MYRAGPTACSMIAPRRSPRTSDESVLAKPCSIWLRDARPAALALLLRLASGYYRVCDDGGGGQCPYCPLPAVSTDPRRFRLGPRDDRRYFLIRLSRLGIGDAMRRSADGPARPKPRCRTRRRRDGSGAAPGAVGAPTVAPLPDAWRIGRWRGQLPRLYRAVTVPDQLVCAP